MNPGGMTLLTKNRNTMSGTYSQIYVQIVFAVKGRENVIVKSWREELHKYISGIITNKNQKAIIVGGYTDHVHAFVGLKPSMPISDLARDIKNNSSKFVNERNFTNGRFSWQEGFGAFSYSASDVENVYNYILNQEKHHQTKKFREEFIAFLQDYSIAYSDKYLFEWYS